MFAVIFEVKPRIEGKEEYLKIASELRKYIENQDGFISIERFQSLTDDRKALLTRLPLVPLHTSTFECDLL